MNWLHFFTDKSDLLHSFGRGINADIASNEEGLFNKSYEAFEKKDVLNAYEYFLKSLLNYSNGDSNENITTKILEDRLEFTLFQDSARICGYITHESFHADAIILKESSADVALKRYLLERNYQFTYSNYLSDGEFIKLKIYHDNITMTPQKLFFPLREIALNADYDKEYIRSEFFHMPIEDIDHIGLIDAKELRIKYEFMQKSIEELLEKAVTLSMNDTSGMLSFLYLNFLFKLDYLLVPKYDIYHRMSRKIQEYFSDDINTPDFKNDEVKEYILELQKLTFEEFAQNFYSAKYTFNPSDRASFEEIATFINESLVKIRWYKNNRYYQVLPIVYEYVAFYALYNYGLHPVVKALLHLLVTLQNSSFFKTLGYETLYDEESKSFSKKTIINKIEDIMEPYKNRFKLLKPFGNELNFTSLGEFSNSFYVQLKHLDFTEN